MLRDREARTAEGSHYTHHSGTGTRKRLRNAEKRAWTTGFRPLRRVSCSHRNMWPAAQWRGTAWGHPQLNPKVQPVVYKTLLGHLHTDLLPATLKPETRRRPSLSQPCVVPPTLLLSKPNIKPAGNRDTAAEFSSSITKQDKQGGFRAEIH